MLGRIIIQVASLYTYLILGYIILSWFPVGGVFGDIRRVLATLVEPYLSIFRRVIPPIGALDISPIAAILVLNVIVSLLVRLV